MKTTEPTLDEIARLATQARRRGCTVTLLDGRATVTDPHRADPLTVTAVSCTCRRYLRHGVCQHLALVLRALEAA